MTYRLGLDIGTNSIGFAIVGLDEDGRPYVIQEAGSRIFSDGRSPPKKQSKAADRRESRSARRNRDRGRNRQERLMRELIRFGLMPADEAARKMLEGGSNTPLEEHDPWILRYRGLDEPVTLYQLGRVIFHLGQRRGYHANRKTDRADKDKGKGKVKDAIARTKARLDQENARTLGELFGKPRLEIVRENARLPRGRRKPLPPARVRISGTGKKLQYDYYPTRKWILAEFDALWAAQARFHADFPGEKARVAIRETLAFQHPLRPVKAGKCTFLPHLERAPNGLASAQQTRIYQELNNLRIRRDSGKEQPLTQKERDRLAAQLLRPRNKEAKFSFEQVRRELGLSERDAISLESEKRKHMDGDKLAAAMMQAGIWGDGWFDLSLAVQDEIALKLDTTESPDDLVDWLMQHHGWERERAEQIADASLPAGHARLSKEAMDRILPILKRDAAITYDKAAREVFGDHANFADGEIHEFLPYYGKILERSVAFGSGEPDHPDELRYGKIANPTVHVALNQVRAVVNELIRRFGKPQEVVIEVARDLPLSAEGKLKLERDQKANQEANEKRVADLDKHGIANNYRNRLRLRLYEELPALNKCCVFSGDQIDMTDLFSGEIEIEHILPFSATFDGGIGNLVLATRQANRDKANRSPYEAFGHAPPGYDWEAIKARVAELPKSKQWRFAPDAMERFEDEFDFMDRQLNNTRYVARLARGYLEALYGGAPRAGGKSHVWVVTGRLTADLRYNWGLDSILPGHNLTMAERQKKNRNDHRHHAVDAIVIAMTDRARVKQASDIAQRSDNRYDRLFEGLPEPWDGFRQEAQTIIGRIVVSHKPDHGFHGAMHDKTAYGIVRGEAGRPGDSGVRSVVTRKPLDGKFFTNAGQLQYIRDERIRMALLEATQGLSGKEFKRALIDAGQALRPPVYRVRIKRRLSVIPIADRRTGEPFKAYQGNSNYCYDIWVNAKGRWTGEVVSTFEAYQRARKDPDWRRGRVNGAGEPLVMRLCKDDMLEIDRDGRRVIVRVCKMTPGRIAMAEHFEANVDARTRPKYNGIDPLKYIVNAPSVLQKGNAIRVTVSPSGQVRRHSI